MPRTTKKLVIEIALDGDPQRSCSGAIEVADVLDRLARVYRQGYPNLPQRAPVYNAQDYTVGSAEVRKS